MSAKHAKEESLCTCDPTEALDAIEQALREAHNELCLIARHRRIELPQVNKNMIDALTHLATLKQQVAELVAFREAHQWRPTPDCSTKNGDRGIVGIWSNILNDWLYISDAVFCWDSEITKLAWRDSENEALESDLSAGRAIFCMPLTPPQQREGRARAKYRKKPVVIEAEVYHPGLEDGFDAGRPYIYTLEGNHYISPGDYIITGVKGERYPCKPDIFAMTYEPAEGGQGA